MRPTNPAPCQSETRLTVTRAREEDGFTLIELLAAIVVLTVGVIALLGTFDSSRKLTLLSERQTSIAHRAQGELERLEAVDYNELAMISKPTHSTESTNPDYYYDYSSPVKCKEVAEYGCYAWNAANTAEEAPLVKATAGECKEPTVEGCGVVSATPTAWTDEHMSGEIYDFVTWETDAVCEKVEKEKKLCSSAESYKRITVVVTIAQSGTGPTQPPVRLSTLMANPNAAPEGSVKNGVQNPLESPKTECGGKPCINGIQRGNPQSWYLHSTPASAPAEPTESPTHATIAASGTCAGQTTTGCPVPDLMNTSSPLATTLYDYSKDQNATGYTRGPSAYGGRLLRAEAECSAAPGNDGGEMWVTPPLGAATKLTGYGALSIYTQTLNDAAATVKLCVAIYDVPESIANLVEKPATRIGEVAEYGPVSWSTSPAPVAPLTEYSPPDLSFVFTFLSDTQLNKLETVTVEKNHRIGLRIWPASSPPSAISIAYDTTGKTEEPEPGKTIEKPGYSALVQLNTE